MSRQSYVLGLMFNDDASGVVLIRKNKPDWMKGMLNGVGGKIEPDETPIVAMVREFKEEAGVNTAPSDWIEFCQFAGYDFFIYGYCMRSSAGFDAAKTMEGEEIVKVSNLNLHPTVRDLLWMIALAEQQSKPLCPDFKYFIRINA